MKTLLCIILVTLVTSVSYAQTAQELGQIVGQLSNDELETEKNLQRIHDQRLEYLGRFKERVRAEQEIKELKAQWQKSSTSAEENPS